MKINLYDGFQHYSIFDPLFSSPKLCDPNYGNQ